MHRPPPRPIRPAALPARPALEQAAKKGVVRRDARRRSSFKCRFRYVRVRL